MQYKKPLEYFRFHQLYSTIQNFAVKKTTGQDYLSSRFKIIRSKNLGLTKYVP
ncbi:hypothetical protein KC19_2G231500 [Ceratodon purpureus]|uniref:Uncharacterized protein n=1 Tax=Ceratodon purpureus TaxID=3225 RepID=A0A8T0IX26_CERPU|nr:hypothetical protein KC19_2G231500 [Ceratodon purpureus]